jgi:hypothetical protein
MQAPRGGEVFRGAYRRFPALVASPLVGGTARRFQQARFGAGSWVAAAAISPAWASESSPARNASAVSGKASNSRAVWSDRDAAPTLTPVVEANQCAAERCPVALPRHAVLDTARREPAIRHREPLRPGEEIHLLLRPGDIERARLEVGHHLFQDGHRRADSLEHTRHPHTSPTPISQSGEAHPPYRTYVRHINPQFRADREQLRATLSR